MGGGGYRIIGRRRRRGEGDGSYVSESPNSREPRSWHRGRKVGNNAGCSFVLWFFDSLALREKRNGAS
jgi:hypothetical protein